MLQDRRILITGASGMMGRALASHLAKNNKVYGVARFCDEQVRGRLEEAGVHCIGCDLGDGLPAALPKDADTLMHFAVFWQCDAQPARALELNAYLVGTMLETLANLEQFVIASTVAVYVGAGRYDLTERSKPLATSMYGLSKLAGDTLATHVARHRQRRGAVLRYWFPYSDDPAPTTNYYGGLVRRLQKGEPFFIDPAEPGVQQPLFIDDIVRITEDALDFASPQTFLLNVSGPETLTHEQVIHTMARVFRCDADIRRESGHNPTLLSGSYDLTKLKETVGMGTVSFEQGLTRLHRRMSEPQV